MNINQSHEQAFTRSLRARNLSPRTIVNYLDATRALRVHTVEVDLADITPAQLTGFFADQAGRNATTAAIRYRALQQFFKWAAAEEVRPDNPMAGMSPPMVPEQPVALLSLDQVRSLLKACDGRAFEDRRDQAMLRLFLEPGGPRLSEITNLSTDDLDLAGDKVTVLGKGRRERPIWFGSKTGLALDRYIRVRGRHAHARSPHLWLGTKGELTVSGVQQMMRRRAYQAGIGRLYPHMLRHTAAHEWLNAGGQETDAMRLFGWRSRAMLGRYGASAADARAADAARRMGLGDRY